MAFDAFCSKNQALVDFCEKLPLKYWLKVKGWFRLMDRVCGIDPPCIWWLPNPHQTLGALSTGQCRRYSRQDLFFNYVVTLAQANTSKHSSHCLSTLAPVSPHHKVYSSGLFFY